MRERVIVQREGERWVIAEIQRLQAEPLPPPSIE